MTDGVLSVIEDWTGYRPVTCPWKAFQDPLVMRVLDVFVAFEEGNLAFAAPHPSHRLVTGLLFFKRVMSRITSEQIALDRKEADRKRQQGGR